LKIISDNLLSYNAYGPVAYLKNQKSAFLNFSSNYNLGGIAWNAHIKGVYLLNKEGLRFHSYLCRVTPIVCIKMLKGMCDTNASVENLKRMPVFAAHYPSGSSTKNLMHFAQFIRKA